MFSTTHDAILLVIAAAYGIVWVLRMIKADSHIRYTPGTFAVPFSIMMVALITAVLW